MSWGSAATEGASSAGSTAASNTASTAGSSVGSTVGTSAAETGVSNAASNAGTSGYSIDAGTAGETANSGGGFWDNTMNGLEKFQKGSDQSLPEAYRGWGNNAETYGYVGGKVRGMAAGGGGNQPANVTTNINYQQPENDYLRRRRGY